MKAIFISLFVLSFCDTIQAQTHLVKNPNCKFYSGKATAAPEELCPVCYETAKKEQQARDLEYKKRVQKLKDEELARRKQSLDDRQKKYEEKIKDIKSKESEHLSEQVSDKVPEEDIYTIKLTKYVKNISTENLKTFFKGNIFGITKGNDTLLKSRSTEKITSFFQLKNTGFFCLETSTEISGNYTHKSCIYDIKGKKITIDGSVQFDNIGPISNKPNTEGAIYVDRYLSNPIIVAKTFGFDCSWSDRKIFRNPEKAKESAESSGYSGWGINRNVGFMKINRLILNPNDLSIVQNITGYIQYETYNSK